MWFLHISVQKLIETAYFDLFCILGVICYFCTQMVSRIYFSPHSYPLENVLNIFWASCHQLAVTFQIGIVLDMIHMFPFIGDCWGAQFVVYATLFLVGTSRHPLYTLAYFGALFWCFSFPIDIPFHRWLFKSVFFFHLFTLYSNFLWLL